MKAVQQRQAAARSERAQCGHGAGNMQLAANAGCRRDPDSEGTCCTNEALQGWSAVQRHVPELRDAAGCECRLAAR